MAKTRKITLTDENWKEIDELLERIPDSEFLRFCLTNEIAKGGMEKLKINDSELFLQLFGNICFGHEMFSLLVLFV